MKQLEIRNRLIGDDYAPYVIAEIGSNHCGDLDLCLEMVETAAGCGVDAAKLQKRDNTALFTRAQLNRPYNTRHSYGATYGDHRHALDWFGMPEFKMIKAACRKNDVAFIVTPFDEGSADFVNTLGVDAVKIASCDLKNTPLMEQCAAFNKPIIISTGGCSLSDLHRAADILSLYRADFAILHCVSTYPNTDHILDLNIIQEFYWLFDQVIGFSSHHPSILPNIIAYTLGARIFEVHFTMNRASVGTDHGFSMEPDGLKRLCEDIGRIETMRGYNTKCVKAVEKHGFVRKFGKSIYAINRIPAGSVIKKDDLCLKAPADGMQPYQFDRVVGHLAKCDIEAETAITTPQIEKTLG